MENRVTVSICGEEYTFVAEEAPSYMQKVGAYVGTKMDEMLTGAKVGRTDAAVLAAANIADELFKEREASEGAAPPAQAVHRRRRAGEERGQRTQARAVQIAEQEIMTELLSPAGGREALVAAVQNGADAVYMGFGSFNARRSARNFSDEEFLAAVRYCHLRGVKVYLTLNTLVTDRELPALAETARRASEYGVDAILVQDWGVYETLRAVIPDVPLHASTQMALHTLSGVEEAARLGMTRAVLARELSGEEIREIAERAPIEIETFAHGALCMCYSGMCEMSAVIGGRSGNRGACAQPCRLRYGWHGKADANPLSLKDANLAAYAGEMAEMGVACLKLEGRMKRPEYVAAVTGIYAALLREHRAPTANEQKKLALAFSRDGFTDGYYRGRRGKEMFGVRPETARWPEEWFGTLRAAYEKEDMRLVPVRFRAALRLGEPMVLTAEDGDGHCVTVTGVAPEAARSRAVTAGEVEAVCARPAGRRSRCRTVR